MLQNVLLKFKITKAVQFLFSRNCSTLEPRVGLKESKYGSIIDIEKTFCNFVKTIPDECNVGDIDLTIDNANSIAIISMNNPKSLNAMSGQMMIEFNKITKHLLHWKDGKAVVLIGANNQFCSGGDLKNFMNFLETDKLGYMMSCYMHKVMKDFSLLPIPTIAVIEGQTLGGGAEIATVTDYRLMSDSSKIGFVQTRLGIAPGWGGATRLVNIVGRKNALELLISGRKLNSKEAVEIKLVDDIFSSEKNSLESTISWLEEKGLLNLSSSLTQGISSVIKSSSNQTEASYARERELFRNVWQGEEHREALRKQIKHR